jgi:hypothetical protein
MALTRTTRFGKQVVQGNLYNGAVAVDSGVWVNVEGIMTGSIVIRGTSPVGQVVVSMVNEEVKPGDAFNIVDAGSFPTTPGAATGYYTVSSFPSRWMKIRLNIYTSGTFIVDFTGQS